MRYQPAIEHKPAHRGLIAEMHIGAGISGSPAEAKPDEDIANFGNGR